MRRTEYGWWLALFCTALLAALPASANDSLWTTLRNGGHVLLMRHAVTEPGIGDPPQFRLDDCSTQRNLSGEGRAQAVRVGRLLAERRIAIGPVLSSRWCRCIDTARLAFGQVTPEPALDSFFGERSAQSAPQTVAARARIRGFRGSGNLIMVTHQVNITALTGEHPAMGEILVVRANADGTIKLVGRIPPPAS
jgi:phosphohistidine phosphatase SixA